MRIAMMVRGSITTPPQNDIAYSPASVAKMLADGLAKRGHAITFFGPEGTHFDEPVCVETCGLQPLATTMQELDDKIISSDLFASYQFGLSDGVLARQMLTRAQAGEFDCVIFHHFEAVLPLAPLFPTVPIVFILHDELDKKRRVALEQNAAPNQHFISISDNQRRNLPDLNYAATIYNGIDTDFFSLNEEAESYLIIAGRIVPEKGVKEAVQIAKQTNRRLLITGSLSKQYYPYFDEEIKPHLDDKILYLGMLDRSQLVKYYQKAAALLAPVQWDEPFGLSMAEAMSCGTPVVAFSRGSVPEIVSNGVSGFVVNNSAEMILAIDQLGKIKRKDCAKHVKEKFSEPTMIDNYERVLREIIDPYNKRKNPKSAAKKPSYIKKNITGIAKLITGQENKR